MTTDEMGEVAEIVRAIGRGKPPASPADFRPHTTAFAGAVTAITEGRCVYVWGAALKPDSQAVLAYGKDIASTGGPVVLQDGTVREMSASEFAAAPKATK